MCQIKCQLILYVCLDSFVKSNVDRSYMSALIHLSSIVNWSYMSILIHVSSQLSTDLICLPWFMCEDKCQQILYICLDSCDKSNAYRSYMSAFIHLSLIVYWSYMSISIHVSSQLSTDLICLPWFMCQDNVSRQMSPLICVLSQMSTDLHVCLDSCVKTNVDILFICLDSCVKSTLIHVFKSNVNRSYMSALFHVSS